MLYYMTDTPSDSSSDSTRARKLARVIFDNSTEVERAEVVAWLQKLREISVMNCTVGAKTKLAIVETAQRRIIWPIIKSIAFEIKRYGWDDRNLATRTAGFGVLTALTLGGAQAGAGIVALGTAVGVPLWIVLGAGGAFVGVILQEIQNLASQNVEQNKEISETDAVKTQTPESVSTRLDSREAFLILGLPEGSGAEEINQAFKRLMRGVHPDSGGSAYLAAQLNAARDVALRNCGCPDCEADH